MFKQQCQHQVVKITINLQPGKYCQQQTQGYNNRQPSEKKALSELLF